MPWSIEGNLQGPKGDSASDESLIGKTRTLQIALGNDGRTFDSKMNVCGTYEDGSRVGYIVDVSVYELLNVSVSSGLTKSKQTLTFRFPTSEIDGLIGLSNRSYVGCLSTPSILVGCNYDEAKLSMSDYAFVNAAKICGITECSPVFSPNVELSFSFGLTTAYSSYLYVYLSGKLTLDLLYYR